MEPNLKGQVVVKPQNKCMEKKKKKNKQRYKIAEGAQALGGKLS